MIETVYLIGDRILNKREFAFAAFVVEEYKLHGQKDEDIQGVRHIRKAPCINILKLGLDLNTEEAKSIYNEMLLYVTNGSNLV